MLKKNDFPTSKRPVILCILDGWGLRNDQMDNAIAIASSPNWNRITKTWPTAQLECCGANVGLPEGQMGNSEVGHLNLGSGRVVLQDLPRIDRAIENGSLAKSSDLNEFISSLIATGGTSHIIGLISPGGVHCHQNHVIALAKIIAKTGVPVCIHAITDGRDTAPKSAKIYIEQLEKAVSGVGNIVIGTICGRYFAMDRDNRWDRVQRAYDLIVTGNGKAYTDTLDIIKDAYANGKTDEFIEPACHASYKGIKDRDGLLCANFRSDRVRQLLDAILTPEFNSFTRNRRVSLTSSLGMVSYSDKLSLRCKSIFSSEHISKTLGEVVAAAGMKQLRAAETEKYPHITYFFNGGKERPNEGETRLLVQSPKVSTYDLNPEMSAQELTNQLIKQIKTQKFDFIVVNYANGDMVGHTGDLVAAVKAVECVDTCIGQLEDLVCKMNGVMVVVSDHGNCESMFDYIENTPHTSHTLNPVPVVLINHEDTDIKIENGKLADVAPTVLQILGIQAPYEMNGKSLIVNTP